MAAITAEMKDWDSFCGVEICTTRFLKSCELLERAKKWAVFTVLSWECFAWVWTTALLDVLAFCVLDSLGSCGLGKLGRLIPWEINRTAASMTNGKKHFLFVR
ncbi:hypothetical protein [Geobacter sp. OR-1]|uniref:hypothetical protein n=1 Tax=Geobacter sp. OR-1 TaxID=1266765 RepID=UPI0005A9863C|nr:hypothetical protein [Geobacter sp. OR-1]